MYMSLFHIFFYLKWEFIWYKISHDDLDLNYVFDAPFFVLGGSPRIQWINMVREARVTKSGQQA